MYLGQRPAAPYPNRDGSEPDGIRRDGNPRPAQRRAVLYRHPDHVCPDGTRITGIVAQHLAREPYLEHSGLTRYWGYYPTPDAFGIYQRVSFPLRFGDRREQYPDTSLIDQQHPDTTPGRAAA